MLAYLWGKEFSLSMLLAHSPQVEVIEPDCYLVEFDPTVTLPLTTGQVGIASCRFVAACAARTTAPGSCRPIPIGQEADFLAPLPINWLPAATETRRRLELLGILTMGQLVQLGKDSLYHQFGQEGMWLWELAQGIDERPLCPYEVPRRLAERIDFDTPCTGGSWLKGALVRAVERLFAQLERELCMALQVKLSLETGDCLTCEGSLAVGTAQSRVAIDHLWRQVSQRQLYAPVEALEVVITATARMVPGELSLFASKRAQHLPALCERLKAKGQPAALMQVAWGERHHRLPERRAYWQSLLDERVRRPIYAPRPIRVVQHHDQPVAVERRRIASILDQWQLVEEWWTPQPIERHYFQVCLTNGKPVRLFREQGQWYRQ